MDEIKAKIDKTKLVPKKKNRKRNDIFYYLETFIKNSNWNNNNIFMNISLFILEYIFLEIILCNAEKVDPQNINDNFKKLESKKCLIKEIKNEKD